MIIADCIPIRHRYGKPAINVPNFQSEGYEGRFPVIMSLYQNVPPGKGVHMSGNCFLRHTHYNNLIHSLKYGYSISQMEVAERMRSPSQVEFS